MHMVLNKGDSMKRYSDEELLALLSSQCHPFYSVKRGRVLSEAGRLEKFQKKYAGVNYGQKTEV